MTWDENRERVIAAAELGDATPRVAVDLMVDARNRAFNAEQNAQELQTELDALKSAHAWIKTLERLPEETCDVLGIVDGVVTLLNYDEFEDDPFVDWSDGTFRGYSVDAVSHWMPLPEAPK